MITQSRNAYKLKQQAVLLSSSKVFNVLQTNCATESTYSANQEKKTSNPFKKIAFLIGTAGAIGVGGLVWTYYSPEDRKKIEQNVPQSKAIFDYIYTNIGLEQPGEQLKIPQIGIQTKTANIEPREIGGVVGANKVPHESKLKLTTVEDISPPPQPSAMPATKKEAKQIDIQPVEIHKAPPKLETPKQQQETNKLQIQGGSPNFEEIEAKIRKERQQWEAEAKAQLKKVAEEHAEHLEKVIKTQKQLHDIENEHRIEEAVKIEQHKFGKQIQSSISKLNEIEKALNSRSAQDLENRRAKIFWTCCQNLIESLINGNEKNGESTEQYSVVLNEVNFIKGLTENDDFAQSICNCFPEQAAKSGIATENGLKKRFTKVYKMARITAQIDQNGGGPLQYFTSWLCSLFVVQFTSAAYSAEDEIDVTKYDPYELLGRIKQRVGEGDFATAVKLANLLRGESASIFRDWIYDAQLHLHSRFLAEILLSHAQVSSIRTTY